MTDPDGPTDHDDTPADPPNHVGPDAEQVEPAFDIDLEPDQQGTAEAAAEPSD